MEDTLGNHSPTSIKFNKRTTNERIGKQSNARKLNKEKNQMKKKNTKEKTKKTSSGESVKLYRRNTKQNMLDSTLRSGSLHTGRSGKKTRSGNRRIEMENEKRGKEKKRKTVKLTGKNGGKIKKFESRKSTEEGKALKRARTSKSILIDDAYANDKKKKHKTSKFISIAHKAQEANDTSPAKKQPGEMEKKVEVTRHLANEAHLIEEENMKGARDTVEKEKNLKVEKSLSGDNMLTCRKEKIAENQVNADYFNLNSINKNINNYNSHGSISNTNHSDTYNNNANAHNHSTHNSNNNTIYSNDNNAPNDNNSNNNNTNNMTNVHQRKQSAKERLQNDALFEKKPMPFEIDGTIKKSFSPLFTKEVRGFFTEDHSNFKLEKERSVTLKNLGSSKCYSTGYIRMSKKKNKSGFLRKQNTKEKDKLKPEEKKRIAVKEKDTVKSKGNSRTSHAAKMKKIVPKLKKERTSEFHLDMLKQRSFNLTNRHVQITDDVQILRPPSRNTMLRGGEGGDSTERNMRGQSLDIHRMEQHEEKDEIEEKEKEEGGESDMDEIEGTLLTAIKSMRLEWAGGEHGEREEDGEESEEADEEETNGTEQSSDGKRSHQTNDEKQKYKEEKEDKVLEEHNGKKENIGDAKEGIEGQKNDLSCFISKNSQEVDIQSNHEETIDSMKEKVDEILKKYVLHKRKKKVQRRMKYTPFTEPLDIKEQSLQMDTIKFLSNVKEDMYCDDIIFFFDNYEKKIKKQEDLIKGFNKLFKSENFDLEGFQSVLLIFDRIIKKMKRDLTTFPLKSLFTHIVREMQNLREVDLQQMQENDGMIYKSTNDTPNVITPNKFAQRYTQSNIIANSESSITEENKLVEVKIKKLKQYHDEDLYNPLNDSSPYKTERLQFIPYLLRRHWHDQNKLKILRSILNEMERRKTPKHVQIADVNRLQTKSNIWDLLCCFNCTKSKLDINECNCQVHSQQNIHPDYSAKSCHRYLPFDYVREIPSHKLSDVIHYMAYN